MITALKNVERADQRLRRVIVNRGHHVQVLNSDIESFPQTVLTKV
jgi:hypothetical protein